MIIFLKKSNPSKVINAALSAAGTASLEASARGTVLAECSALSTSHPLVGRVSLDCKRSAITMKLQKATLYAAVLVNR